MVCGRYPGGVRLAGRRQRQVCMRDCTPLAGCCVALLADSAGVAGAVAAVRLSLCVVCLYKL